MALSRRRSGLGGAGNMNPRIQVPLPAPAQLRLTQLNIERDSAFDQARALQNRVNACDGTTDSLIRERLAAEQQRHSQRQQTLHRLLSAVQQWWFQLRLPNGYYIKQLTVPAKVEKGQTPAEAIGKLRVEMLSIAQDLAKVRRAPLPIPDQVAAAERFIAGKALVGMPRIGVVRDQLQLSWADDIITSKSDVFTILCALFPKSMLDALKREIEQSPAAANAMPAAERDQQVRELESRLLDLERRESALLDKAEGAVLPRHDMNPLAYLQIEIVAREAQQQVA
jgi:hypothetical protein